MRSKSKIKWWYFFVPLVLLAITVSYKVVEGLTKSMCSGASTCQACSKAVNDQNKTDRCYWCSNATNTSGTKGACYDANIGCPIYSKGCTSTDCNSGVSRCPPS